MTRTHRRTHCRLLILTCALLSLALAACGGEAGPSPEAQVTEEQATETSSATTRIPFTSLAQDAPLGDQPADPYYAVIDNSQSGESWQGMVPEDVVTTVQEANREQDDIFVIAFAGAAATSGYSVTIEQIIHQSTDITVTVSRGEPDPDDVVEPAMTLPYHVVAISSDQWPQESQVSTVTFRDGGGNLLVRQQLQNQ